MGTSSFEDQCLISQLNVFLRGMKITENQRGIKLIRKSTDGDQCLIPQLNVFLRGMKITEYQRGIK